jgi:hypothetical protein
MPKGNIYETARAPGVAAGKYSAGLYGVSDIWGKMESGQERFKFEEEQRGKALDTMLAALETTSTIYEGVMAKQEFKSDVRTVQKMEAKKAFGDIPEGELPLFEDETMDFSQYIKTDPGKEWYEGFEGKKMGRAGIFGGGEEKEWGEMYWGEKIFQQPDYKFGEETLSRGAITARAEAGEYGYDPNFDAFEDLESYDYPLSRSVDEMEEQLGEMEGTTGGGTQTLLEEAGSDTTSAVPGNIIALRPDNPEGSAYNVDAVANWIDRGSPSGSTGSTASEGGSLFEETMENIQSVEGVSKGKAREAEADYAAEAVAGRDRPIVEREDVPQGYVSSEDPEIPYLEGGPLSQGNIEMLTGMATTFKEKGQAPVLSEDLFGFQVELDKIVKDMGWMRTGIEKGQGLWE